MEVKNFEKCKMGIDEDSRNGCRSSKKLRKKSSSSSSSSSCYCCCSKMEVKKCERYFCKQCGKGFKSPRAVFGHMRSHSKKNTNTETDETETNTEVPRKKRSVGRYKINPASSNTSWSYLNTSSSSSSHTLNNHSHNDEQLEDIAVSLLMLANGSSYGCGGSSLPFSDDHHHSVHQFNSDVVGHLEPTFPSFKQSQNDISAVDSRFNSIVLFEDCLGSAEIKDKQASASASVSTSTGVGTIHTSINPPTSTCAPTVYTTDHESDLFRSETKEDKMLCNFNPLTTCHLPVEQTKVVDHKCNSGTQTDDGLGLTVMENLCFKEYKCSVCSRTFLSHQALGGHRLHCPRKKKFSRPRANATTYTRTVVPQHDNNNNRCTHKCLICCKAFSSGQALGGHMRAHFNANV